MTSRESGRGAAAASRLPIAAIEQIDASYCLHFLRSIRDVAFATVDERGLPSVRIVDVMHAEDDRLYFLAPRGKAFYAELQRAPIIAIVGQTNDHRTCRLRGSVVRPQDDRERQRLVDWMFELNPFMSELYPGDSRSIIEVFSIERGQGEYFDLGQKPILRVPFIFGGDAKEDAACASRSGLCAEYRITARCSGCGACVDACPQRCIEKDELYRILPEHCLRCGLCAEICPVGAIERERGAIS